MTFKPPATATSDHNVWNKWHTEVSYRLSIFGMKGWEHIYIIYTQVDSWWYVTYSKCEAGTRVVYELSRPGPGSQQLEAARHKPDSDTSYNSTSHQHQGGN